MKNDYLKELILVEIEKFEKMFLIQLKQLKIYP